MWTYKHIANFHERVRQVLNTNLVTDEQMDFFEKAPLSEIYIKSVVTKWEEIKKTSEIIPTTEEEVIAKQKAQEKFSIFETCIILHTAIKLEKFVDKRTVKSKKVPSMTIEYSVNGYKDDSTPSLQESLDQLIDILTKDETGTGFFYGFRVT